MRADEALVELTNNKPPVGGRSVNNIYATAAAWTSHPYKAVLGAERPDPDEVGRAVARMLSLARSYSSEVNSSSLPCAWSRIAARSSLDSTLEAKQMQVRPLT